MPTAVGVIADSYNAATGPIPLTGLVGWWDADDASTFTYSSGVLVAEWRDKSGGAHHAGIGLGNQPSRVGTINARPVVTFTTGGSPQALAVAPFATAYTAGELFAVVKLTAELGGSILSGWGPGGEQHYPYTDGNIYEPWGTNARKTLGNPAPDLKVAHVYNVRTAAGSYIAAINGTQLYSTASNTPSFALGGGFAYHWLGRADASYRLDGLIGEVIMYSRVLTGGERGQVETHLRTKWGTP